MATLSKPKLQVKNIDRPDETRAFAQKGHADIIQFEHGSMMRGTFEPGWKWSQHVAPIAKTHSCEAVHVGFVVSGHMKIRMDDGSESEIGPGDVFRIPAGHDAWVVGNEACVLIDFGGYSDYAKPASAGTSASATSSKQGVTRK